MLRRIGLFLSDGQGGWCGAESPFGNGARHRLALMVVAADASLEDAQRRWLPTRTIIGGCTPKAALGRRTEALLADADNHRRLHAESCHCLCSTVAPAPLPLGRLAN